MIAHLKGKLTHKSPVAIIIDVNGVGYQVFVPLSTFYALPELESEISLGIHTHMREEALKLLKKGLASGYIDPEYKEKLKIFNTYP